MANPQSGDSVFRGDYRRDEAQDLRLLRLEIVNLREQLAASHAENARLREHVRRLIDESHYAHYNWTEAVDEHFHDARSESRFKPTRSLHRSV